MEIKVNKEELTHMIILLNKYQEQLDVSEEEKDFSNYVNLKYIDLKNLQKEEKTWYEQLQNLKNPNFIKDVSNDELEYIRKSVWEIYNESKTKREDLQRVLFNYEKTINIDNY